ncbi:hypothetical protein CPB84DRAFT_1746257 [Gymnopilus junonius]|uniref:Uncharacterized protein n=1 Tax=Gymnopilus junonius TaxID=109634 RepID=A0A9P5TQB8_GYMJU|nr:hypothetical protein CPB84DRAFT_1746257 [Gymnopilus junonius]
MFIRLQRSGIWEKKIRNGRNEIFRQYISWKTSMTTLCIFQAEVDDWYLNHHADLRDKYDSLVDLHLKAKGAGYDDWPTSDEHESNEAGGQGSQGGRTTWNSFQAGMRHADVLTTDGYALFGGRVDDKWIKTVQSFRLSAIVIEIALKVFDVVSTFFAIARESVQGEIRDLGTRIQELRKTYILRSLTKARLSSSWMSARALDHCKTLFDVRSLQSRCVAIYHTPEPVLLFKRFLSHKIQHDGADMPVKMAEDKEEPKCTESIYLQRYPKLRLLVSLPFLSKACLRYLSASHGAFVAMTSIKFNFMQQESFGLLQLSVSTTLMESSLANAPALAEDTLEAQPE